VNLDCAGTHIRLISEIMRAVLKSPEYRKFFLATSTFPQYESPAQTQDRALFAYR
jgi:tripartite-type tricarboxylate transporter receptor subunit TctC